MAKTRYAPAAALAVALTAAFATTLHGDHAWGPYHWARTTRTFTLTVVNSTTGPWHAYVSMALADWSRSGIIGFEEVAGSTQNGERRQCRPPAGQVRICNLEYGFNGWLGVAGITVDGEGHIHSAYTKLNDTYFNAGYYNTGDWRQSVACQELGQDLGLDHQDEDFDNVTLETCMDYQDPPWPFPNAHDYEQLVTIYEHMDAYDSFVPSGPAAVDGGSGAGTCNAPPGRGCNKATVGQSNSPSGWGISLGRRGARERFIRIEPDGTRHLTHVTWAEIQ
jgi:hypothetical protein